MLKFQKMNGAGNDFVVIDNLSGSLKLSAEQIVRLCDRHRGVGADGILLVEPPESGADFRMRYFNADGGEAEMCGNGARCFARFARQLSGMKPHLRFETMAGIIEAAIDGELVTLTMSTPLDLHVGRNLALDGKVAIVHSINTGVPHAVEFVEHLEQVNVVHRGGQIRWHEAFQPKGTNVNFVRQLGAQQIAVRTYERGVENETLACGTGVVASAIVHAMVHQVQGPIAVQVRGGDHLTVDFEHDGHHFRKVTLTGPADFAFAGEIEIGS